MEGMVEIEALEEGLEGLNNVEVDISIQVEGREGNNHKDHFTESRGAWTHFNTSLRNP